MYSVETIGTDSLELVVPSDIFKMMPLNKFCVKRFFEVGFIHAANVEDEMFIDRLVALNKTKEDITHVTFINEHEVKNFFENVANGNDDFEFPPSLLPELKQFVQYASVEYNDMETMMEYMAYKLKFKLIQTMYEQFGNEVKEMRRQEMINRDLDLLAERKSSPKSKKPPTTSSSKSGRKNEKFEKEDYTDVDLVENELVIDDIAKNQVYFYIFRGFNSIDILKYLLKAAVKLSFIVKVSEFDDEKKHPNHFWREYTFIRNCPCDYLQNLAVFKYQAPPHDDIQPMLEFCLKELTDIIKTLIDYKRLHFHYIKNLKIVNTKFTETFREFPIYDKIMDSYPVETTTIPLIMNGMLQEVQMKQDKVLKSQSIKSHVDSSFKHKAKCPFDIKNSMRPVRVRKDSLKISKSFKTYERDFINLTFKSYEGLGIQYATDNIEILKLQKPIELVQNYEFEERLDDFHHHTHDVMIPREDEPCFTEEQTTHLINLLYLKNRYFQENEEDTFTGNELTKNLLIYNRKRHMKEMVPLCLSEEVWKINEPFIDHFPDSNPYQVLRPMALHWAEILKPEVLFQYLSESELKFPYCDYIICQLTKSLILRYHYNVNSFGSTTKVWHEYLRTPVGLGDFCKFTLVDDYDWLNKNMPCPQVTYAEVTKTLEEHTAMHQYVNVANRDYKYLLVPQIQYSNSDIRQTTHCPCIEENVCKILESCNAHIEAYPVITANLIAILKELEEYNNVVDFSEHCKGKSDTDYSFSAYNFGVTKFSIVGHTTDFVSLDNVKVTVDTSRFCRDYFKMMAKITTDHNSLVIHIPQNRFSCHITLSDGTIVVFSKPIVPKIVDEKSETSEKDSLILLDLHRGDADRSERTTQDSEISNFLFQEKEKPITSLDFDHYSSLNLYPTVGNIIRESPMKALKTNIKKDVDLLKRLQDYPNCLKVTRKDSKALKFVHRRIPERQIAMSSVVKRILHKKVQRAKCDTIKRKCIIKGGNETSRTNKAYDCVVTVPNGLTLRVLPSELQYNTSVIKQSYDLGSTPEAIADEKYRMFTQEGTVIVGKLDGSIHLFMSSGRELRFTKPVIIKDDEMFCTIKKDLTDDLVRNLFTRIMTIEEQNPEAMKYYISRRSHLKSKYASVSSCENFKEISKLPYSSFSMITFEGEKIKIKQNKMYKYHYSRHTTNINFQTEERNYRRDDGFSGRIDRDGTQYIEFSDGTSIKTVVSFAETPIRINKKDTMGWILITSTFLYEHPYYKPVYFDNINSNIEIQINNYDSLNINPVGGILNMRNNTQINVKTDYIDYLKFCNNCDGQYKCRLFVEPLYEKRNLKYENEYFLSVEDSYKKTFKADFQGNCKIDPNYLPGPVNDKRCSHSLPSDHQRIYLIKKNLEGMILWNDKAASAFMKDSEEDKVIHHYNDERNSLVFLTINKNVFSKFNERFFGKSLRQIDFPFDRTHDEKNVLAYQIVRNLYSMFELDQIDGLMSCLKKFFQDSVMKELALSLSALRFHLSTSKFSIHSLSQIYPEDTEIKIKPSISLHEKLKENSKKFAVMKNILRMPLPNYFHSKFCTFVDPVKIASQTKVPSKVKSEVDLDS